MQKLEEQKIAHGLRIVRLRKPNFPSLDFVARDRMIIDFGDVLLLRVLLLFILVSADVGVW